MNKARALLVIPQLLQTQRVDSDHCTAYLIIRTVPGTKFNSGANCYSRCLAPSCAADRERRLWYIEAHDWVKEITLESHRRTHPRPPSCVLLRLL